MISFELLSTGHNIFFKTTSYYIWLHTQACLNYELLQMDPNTGVSKLRVTTDGSIYRRV